MIWTKKIVIPYYLCDHTDHLLLHGAARMFQDVADEHVSYEHIGFADLVTENKAWILSRICYEVHRMPKAEQVVQLATWSRRANKLYATRDTQMTDLDGNVLLASTSLWVIMDMQTRHVLHMLPKVIDYDHEGKFATSIDDLERIRLPKESTAVSEYSFLTLPSNLDHNLHVNNAEYIRWAIDILSRNATISQTYSPQPMRFEINYQKEIPIRTQVELKHVRSGSTDYVSILRGNEDAAICKIDSILD